MRSLAPILKTRRSLVPTNWSVAGDVIYNSYSFYKVAYDGVSSAIGVAQGNIYSLSTDNGSTWKTYANPYTDGANFTVYGVEYGDGKWLMGFNWLAKSTDGVNWTMLQFPPLSYSIRDIKYNGTDLWIITTSLELATSADGENWNVVPLPNGNKATKIAYGNGIWVLATETNFPDPSEVYTSPDGITWTLRYTGLSKYQRALNFSNGVFIIFGAYSDSARSVDGINWTVISLPATLSQSLDGDNAGTFVSTRYVSFGNVDAAVSYDAGLTWSLIHTSAVRGEETKYIKYMNGEWFFFSKGSFAYKTSDFITYTDISMFGACYTPRIGVDTYNNSALAVSVDALGNSRSSYSADNVSWASVESSVKISDSSGGTTTSNNNGTFVSTAYNASVATTVDNGITWTSFATGETFVADVAYGDGKFVLTAYSSGVGKVYSSTDGLSWSLGNTYSSNNHFGGKKLVYGNGIWVSGISGSTVSISADGINWTSYPTPPLGISATNDIIFANNMWIVVADHRSMAYSYDGTTWVGIDHSTLSYNINFKGIAWDGNIFLVSGGYVVGDYNLLASTDGINWTYGTSGQFLSSLGRVRYINGEFLIPIGYSAVIRSVSN